MVQKLVVLGQLVLVKPSTASGICDVAAETFLMLDGKIPATKTNEIIIQVLSGAFDNLAKLSREN